MMGADIEEYDLPGLPSPTHPRWPPWVHLRCLRCGEWHESEVTDPYLPLICGSCFSLGTDIFFADEPDAKSGRRFARWCQRWEKGQERHPAFKAFTAAFEQWAATRVSP